jgi:hypothetical protein
MKLRSATTLVLAMTLFLSAFTVLASNHPAKADPPPDVDPPPPFQLNDYGPRDSDNVVLKWDEELLQAIRLHPAQTGPTITARAIGVVHTSIYDAWAAYDPVAKGVYYRLKPDTQRTEDNKKKAISFAAYTTLLDLFPVSRYPNIGQAAFAGQMQALGYVTDGSDPSLPAQVGIAAANAVLAYRHADGSNQTNGYANNSYPYTPKNTWDHVADRWAWQPLCVPNANPPAGATLCPGGAVQSATTPHWQNIKPFALTSAQQFKVAGPPRTLSGYSTADIVQALADTSNLDDRKKVTAEYWADGPKSEFPPGHWAIFAQVTSRRLNNSLDTDAKMFFALGSALMDASIASWYQKYKWDFVRPITAIREQYKGQMINSWKGPNQGYGDVPAEQWIPYQAPNVVTPPFPEYVSGHSTFSGAAQMVLRSFTGSDVLNASVTVKAGASQFESNTPARDVTMTWATYTAAADDAGISRRYGGIHFKSGDYHGRSLGQSIGNAVWVKARSYFNGTAA